MVETLGEYGESRYSIKFLKHEVMRWFNQHQGRTNRLSPLTYIGDKKKAKKVTCPTDMKNMVSEDKALVCFLEKDFFHTIGRKIIPNHLPLPVLTNRRSLIV